LEREYGISGAIKMASNENPLGPSSKAIIAIKKCLNHIYRYPDANAQLLKFHLAQKLGISEDSILIANGSNEVIELTLKLFLRCKQEVIIPEPTFSLYAKFTQALDGIPVRVPLKSDFCINLEAIRDNITSQTRIIFINNPNNPTGTIIKKRELEKFLKLLPENIIVVLDEAYGEFVEDPEFPQGKDYLLNPPPWVITLRTFSKVYGLAGLRIGYGLASPEIISYLNRVRQPFNVNILAQAAAVAALADQEHFEKTLQVVSEGRRYLSEQFNQLGIKYIPSHSNFIMFYLGKNCLQIYEGLLERGVIVRPLTSFGFPEYLRVSIGTFDENKRFIQSLKEALFSLK